MALPNVGYNTDFTHAVGGGELHPVVSHNTAKSDSSSDPEKASNDKHGDDEKHTYVHDAKSQDNIERIELTPMQAFKWNVDGDQSPFPEVAASVPVTDDPTIKVNNFRMWVLLTIFVTLFAGVNQFFGLRYPSLSLGYVVCQILVFPIGKGWEKLPTWRVGTEKFGFRINPGKFTIKEHAIIVICVSLTGSTAYGLGTLVAIQNPHYWNTDWGAGFSFLFLLTSQSLGFGLAGLTRRWLVYPAALIWPSTLASAVLFRALHEEQDRSPANGWTISRYRFFGYFTLASFIWFWFPDYLCTSLSSFAFVTWIWPHNQKVGAIFGMNSGLGLLPISFDWTVITYAGSPLLSPFWVTANCFAVVVLFYLFLSPILYYTGVWYSDYLPLLSSSTFDNTGKAYNITKVVDANKQFVLAKYQAYSPMYISMSYSLSYALSFAAVTAIIVHTCLYNGPEIWAKFKDSRAGGEDIHKRMMAKYREVPDWWYAVMTAVVLGLGIFTIRYYPTELPVWGFIVFCFGMGCLLIIPEGILEGTTNQRVFLNIITELIAGYVFPGKPFANGLVKAYGYNSVKHGLDLASDLKLGQYMKIAPRILFATQCYSAVLSAAVQTGVLRWMAVNIKDLCSPTNTQRFTCNGSKVVYNAMNIWGVIGPSRLFATGETYSSLLYFFAIGPVVTVIVYLLYRRYPNSLWRYVNVPIFFNAAGNIPPATTTQYSLWFIVGFIFNYLIRQRAFAWWKRYNYLLQAAMDTGVALATIIIFFCLSYTGVKLVWGGNTVGANTTDSLSTPWRTIKQANITHFGRGVGEF